ncbi:MAG: UvrD-helicase domain-containing protein, partial [Firmicutes bacterium]|nr:UvrD-helicase domain-containing protein [Bacillota bacterium]
MAWTSRQQDAIDSRNETLLVSAAAGSGKTSVLVERVLGLILKDHISLENMLIVTLTNAAASEMKEKI